MPGPVPIPNITGGPAFSESGNILPEFHPSNLVFNFGANPNTGLAGSNAFFSPNTAGIGTLAAVGLIGWGAWQLLKRKRG